MLHETRRLQRTKVVTTSSGTSVNVHMAAVSVRSSGAGLEILPFAVPVPAVGRLEYWLRDVERQIVSAIAHDIDCTLKVLREHGSVGGPGRPPLLHTRNASRGTGFGGGGSVGRGDGDNDQLGAKGTAATKGGGQKHVGHGYNGPGVGNEDGEQPTKFCPSLQGQLLARSAHWTAMTETALRSHATSRDPILDSGGDGIGCGLTGTPTGVESGLRNVLASTLVYVDGWVEELLRPGGMTSCECITNTALVTQALQHRDVVEDLLGGSEPAFLAPAVSSARMSGVVTTSAAFRPPVASSRTSSDAAPAQSDGHGIANSKSYPFAWTCHLRHYYVSLVEAAARKAAWNSKADAFEEVEDDPQTTPEPPPPPLIRVGLGAWNIPYGFEYEGTLERLWLTPLSERCLLHAVYSAKVP